MEPEVGLTVARALFPKLSVFHEIGQGRLHAVWHTESPLGVSRVVLDFGRISLEVIAVTDDDSIDFQCLKANELKIDSRDANDHWCWKDFIGAPFGWGWITINQQGYCDGLLLSFGGIDPQVSINIVASAIRLRRIAEAPES